jgi:SAM-dependent methyltransferase
MSIDSTLFRNRGDGVFLPATPVEHREDEYDPDGFLSLREMQTRHFWYRGRHRFLLHNLKRAFRSAGNPGPNGRAGIDLGGGCGGWAAYLNQHAPGLFGEFAVADSSVDALEFAGGFVGTDVRRYQIDLLQLPWRERWDAAFLLDVLEHIPQDEDVLREVHQSLRPGGYLFVTTPALKCFWSYCDDLSHHVRRYSRRDFAELAQRTGFELCWSRYFMFFLSPLLLLSRLKSPDLGNMTAAEIQAHLQQIARVPGWPVNSLLGFIFGLETPLGAWLPFPWGTSVLGVFRKRGG